MTKLLLIAALFTGGLFAQGQCPGSPDCNGYYNWAGTYYPFGSSPTFWSPNSPVGYYNLSTALNQHADWADSSGYCWTYPSPNFYIYFGYVMVGECPEGVYITELAYNGDSSVPSTVNHLMFVDGTSIDQADGFTQIELIDQYWSCPQYYNGPTTNYDWYPNPCIG